VVLVASEDVSWRNAFYAKYKNIKDVLLQNALVVHRPNQDQQIEIQSLNADVVERVNQLENMDEVLHRLYRNRDEVKKGLWFLDSDARQRVEIIQMEINDHKRNMDHTLDEIDFRLLQIKPLYGVFSKMFFVEMLGFLPWAAQVFLSVVQFILLFDLATFIVAGPVAFFVLFFIFSLGFQFFSFLFSMILFGVTFYWLFYLPFIIIQYNPSLFEFLAIYIPFLGLFFVVSSYFFGVFGERSKWRTRRVTTTVRRGIKVE